MTVTTNARITRIDHVTYSRHGERRFSNIGGKDDAQAPPRRIKYAILLSVTQPRIKRKYLYAIATPQRLRQITNLPLARTKNQDVATRTVVLLGDLIDKLYDLLLNTTITVFNAVEIVHLDRERPTRDFDDRRIVKMFTKSFNIDRRRRNNDF